VNQIKHNCTDIITKQTAVLHIIHGQNMHRYRSFSPEITRKRSIQVHGFKLHVTAWCLYKALVYACGNSRQTQVKLKINATDTTWLPISTCAQKLTEQGVYKSSPTNFRISGRFPGDIQIFQEIYIYIYLFLNSRRFLRGKPCNIKIQVKFVMSINEHVMMSSNQCSSLCHPTRLLWTTNLKTSLCRVYITLVIIKFSSSIN